MDISSTDALATLGFKVWREEWARSQLLVALHILQNGGIELVNIIGSWADTMAMAGAISGAAILATG